MRAKSLLFWIAVSFCAHRSGVRAQDPVESSSSPVVITHEIATDQQDGRADVLAAIGDVNGDLVSDFAIGYRENLKSPMVSAVEGRSGREVWSVAWPTEGDSTTASSVWAITSIRDVDGDGVRDLLVGARSDFYERADQSRVYVVSGREGDILRRLTAPEPARVDYFGYDVSELDDLNGDGIRELGIGSMNGGNGGRAYVYDGMTWQVLHTWEAPDTVPPPSLGGRFGESIESLGDVNADGVGEIAVGASYDLGGRGTVSVYGGINKDLLYRIESPVFDQWSGFGEAIASIGDVNADGVTDFVVGAPYFGSESTGKVFVFSGSDGSLHQTLSADVPRRDGFFGSAISAVQDFDSDGVPDVLVSAPGGSYGGAWYICSGRTGETIVGKHSPNRTVGGRFGWSATADSGLVGVLAPFESAPRLYLYKYEADPTPPFEFDAIYPNPTSDAVTLRVSLPETVSYRLTVLDAQGRTVYRTIVDGVVGFNELPISFRGHASGVYAVLVEGETRRVTGSVTVIR